MKKNSSTRLKQLEFNSSIEKKSKKISRKKKIESSIQKDQNRSLAPALQHSQRCTIDRVREAGGGSVWRKTGPPITYFFPKTVNKTEIKPENWFILNYTFLQHDGPPTENFGKKRSKQDPLDCQPVCVCATESILLSPFIWHFFKNKIITF